jgi:DNA-binding transcriptional MocR family regulator
MVADDAAERHERQTADREWIEERKRWEQARAQAKAWWSAQPGWVDRAFTERRINKLRPIDAWRRALMMARVHRQDSEHAERALFTSAAAKAVGQAIAEYAAPGMECTHKPPSGETLARDTGCSRRTVEEARSQLEAAGFIQIASGSRPKRMTLRLPDDVEVVDDHGPRLERVEHSHAQLDREDKQSDTDRVEHSQTQLDSDERVEHSQTQLDAELSTIRSRVEHSQTQEAPVAPTRSKPATEEGLSSSVQDAREHDDALAKLVDVFTAESGERPRVVVSSLRYPSCRVSGCPRRQFGVDLCHVHEGEEDHAETTWSRQR